MPNHPTRTLSAGYACWNCDDRRAPTWNNGLFLYLVCLDEEREPICKECVTTLRHEEFRVVMQQQDGTIL